MSPRSSTQKKGRSAASFSLSGVSPVSSWVGGSVPFWHLIHFTLKDILLGISLASHIHLCSLTLFLTDGPLRVPPCSQCHLQCLMVHQGPCVMSAHSFTYMDICFTTTTQRINTSLLSQKWPTQHCPFVAYILVWKPVYMIKSLQHTLVQVPCQIASVLKPSRDPADMGDI